MTVCYFRDTSKHKNLDQELHVPPQNHFDETFSKYLQMCKKLPPLGTANRSTERISFEHKKAVCSIEFRQGDLQGLRASCFFIIVTCIWLLSRSISLFMRSFVYLVIY